MSNSPDKLLLVGYREERQRNLVTLQLQNSRPYDFIFCLELTEEVNALLACFLCRFGTYAYPLEWTYASSKAMWITLFTGKFSYGTLIKSMKIGSVNHTQFFVAALTQCSKRCVPILKGVHSVRCLLILLWFTLKIKWYNKNILLFTSVNYLFYKNKIIFNSLSRLEKVKQLESGQSCAP